jgi:predicted metal-dependent hydrolase
VANPIQALAWACGDQGRLKDAEALFRRALAIRKRSKWASCSTAGNLNFSEDLLTLDRELADYVIVHELLHFYVPNHGKLRKSLMRAHLGDYERAESKLKTKAAMLSGQQP